jgi:hypothetical protein
MRMWGTGLPPTIADGRRGVKDLADGGLSDGIVSGDFSDRRDLGYRAGGFLLTSRASARLAAPASGRMDKR